MLTLKDLEKIPNEILIQDICKKYNIEQVGIEDITPEYLQRYFLLIHRSLSNVIKMAIKSHDLPTATLAVIILKSLEIGPKLHNELSLILVKIAQKFFEENENV